MTGRPGGRAFVRVALPLPLRRLFNYRVPAPAPPPGTRVRAPFRGRALEGWIMGPGEEVKGIRDVTAVFDRRRAVGGELLDLARWIADYYVAPVGMVLRAMLPAGGRGRPRMRKVVRATREIGTLDEADEVFGRAARQREAFERLVAAGGSMPLAALLENGFSRGVIGGLETRGLVELAHEAGRRDPFQGEASQGGPALNPTPAQREVLGRMNEALDGGGGTLLLHGVTSSGKTLVYIELIRSVLARGRGAIVLVPEIALTPQTVSRFRAAFGDLVAVVHSSLSRGERFDAWQELKSGAKRIAIGARSAVFAPLPDLGAVVVDEEHDTSYKQSTAPRYHARDVAVVRAGRCGAVCVLGSATPSLESWRNAQAGKYALLTLPQRVGGGALPEVRVVHLKPPSEADPKRGGASRASSGAAPAPPPHVLSPLLMEKLRGCVGRDEQAILLLNRRGYASLALCRTCGYVMECVHCSVSMTLHRSRRLMICHHCGHTKDPPQRCGECGSATLSYRGLGTEQVERVLVEALPEARVARMDVDTTGGKWSHHDILDRFRSGGADVLLGTQMIAKGLDFPRVTLVGVINADIGLHLPDFRACEHTFQLLSQVAGRAGRGALPGEVVIQTYVPKHHVVRAAVAHDYHGFVAGELASRTDPPYPPWLRLARIALTSPVQGDAMASAQELGRWLHERCRGGPEILGPAPAPIERVKGRFRWHLLLRGKARELSRALAAAADEFRPSGTDVIVAIDRDPLDLL